MTSHNQNQSKQGQKDSSKPRVKVVLPNPFVFACGSTSSTPNIRTLLHKVNHLIFEKEFKKFSELYLNKSHEQEYFLTNEAETTFENEFSSTIQKSEVVEILEFK